MLDFASETLKRDASVKAFVDGDTVHFFVSDVPDGSGVLKARFLAVNAPESTGRIEEYGKAAARFTREKLERAERIVLESDTGSWDRDGTGTRTLVWVWYRVPGEQDFRCLNIELLEEGLARLSSAGRTRYGSVCMAAAARAQSEKLRLFSGEKDPDFYYGNAVELTLRELRCHTAAYEGMTVAFIGNVIQCSGNTVYVEESDPETGLCQGIPVYCGYSLSGDGLHILTPGNRVRVVGKVQYYEAGQCWQISDVSYRAMRPDDPANLKKLGEGFSPAFPVTDAGTLLSGTAAVPDDGEYPYALLTLHSSVSLEHMKVLRVKTHMQADGSSDGATLFCEQNGIPVSVRTGVLYGKDREIIPASLYEGRTVTVRGIVDCYNGEYRVRVFSADRIIIEA